MVRITRSVTLDLINEEFIQAAHARGERSPTSWRRSPAQCLAADRGRSEPAHHLRDPAGRGLSFVGMGAQPPSSDWGLMIAEARPFIDRAPWIALAPGFAMCIRSSASIFWATACARRSIPAFSFRGRMSRPALLSVSDLTVAYETRTGRLKALDDVSFSVFSGEALALVGESGSGKSTIALAAMGLLGPEAAMSGRISFEDRDLAASSRKSGARSAAATSAWCSRIRSPRSTRACGSACKSPSP
jgi:ABC-type multidrug transport system fused ATPase/permease subunit